jgi:hypothetical protein
MRLQRAAMGIGATAMLGLAAGYARAPQQTVLSYLTAALFWLGISLGALANLMLHNLTGGRWGIALRPALWAAARLMPLTALLTVPWLFGIRRLYPWIEAPAARQHWWLNEPFFIARSLAYLSLWSVLAWAWGRAALFHDAAVLRKFSALGLIAYGFTMSLAAVDWIMSLLPQWYSTGFGLLVASSQMLCGMAFGIVATAALRARLAALEPQFPDLGNLLLMYSMTWMYLAFTQFLIIWAADLPREIVWYLPRVQTSWRWLMLAVVLLQFVLPFCLLLSRANKRNANVLSAIAAVVLFAGWLNVFDLVAPSIRQQGFHLLWSDALAALGIGGFWFAGWLRGLRLPTTESLHA